MAASSPPYERSRDFIARQFGLGRTTVVGLTAACLVLSAGLAGTAGWAIHVTKDAADRVERYIVYLDEGHLPVGQVRVGGAWEARDGAFIDFAKRWVRQLRVRPRDEEELKFQRREVIRTTDQALFGVLQEVMRQADAIARSTAIDVTQIAANLVERKGDRAVVFVRWTEKLRAGNAPAMTYTATLNLAYAEPSTSRALAANPLGIWAVNFQPTLESK